jgi:hypothetical protein
MEIVSCIEVESEVAVVSSLKDHEGYCAVEGNAPFTAAKDWGDGKYSRYQRPKRRVARLL